MIPNEGVILKSYEKLGVCYIYYQQTNKHTNMTLGNQPFTLRFSVGKQAEEAFHHTFLLNGVELKRENVTLEQRNKMNKVLNHTPDFYYKEKNTFFEVKMTYNIRKDLFDYSEQWLKQYGNEESVLYYAIYSKHNDYIEFYNVVDLQQDKTHYNTGKWSDGNEYYTINPEITAHKKLLKISNIF